MAKPPPEAVYTLGTPLVGLTFSLWLAILLSALDGHNWGAILWGFGALVGGSLPALNWKRRLESALAFALLPGFAGVAAPLIFSPH